MTKRMLLVTAVALLFCGCTILDWGAPIHIPTPPPPCAPPVVVDPPADPPAEDPCQGKTPRCSETVTGNCYAVNGGECGYMAGPDPVPTDPTPISACPKKPADGAVVWVNAKRYGNGIDTETRVWGDSEFCFLIHGTYSNNCHLEGWPTRVECEMELIGGCPVLEWRAVPTDPWQLCQQSRGDITCDHFGNTADRDDPQTPTTGTTLETLRGFEGQPLVCGLQRDASGEPQAGFFAIAHGKGQIRACRPDRAADGCSNQNGIVDVDF